MAKKPMAIADEPARGIDGVCSRIRHKTFKPFGGDYASVGTLQSWNVSYAGHRRHDDTGLYYMQARWMDPNAGTFLSIDPLVPNAYDPQTVNPFAYARNNPINWIDPDGQAACGPLGIACWGLTPSEIANWLGSGFSGLAPEQFFDDEFHTLHEHYHVIRQWRTGELTRRWYLWEGFKDGRDNKFEQDADDFARENQGELRRNLGR